MPVTAPTCSAIKSIEGGEVEGSDCPEMGRDVGAAGGGIGARGVAGCGSRADKVQGREQGKGEHVYLRTWASAKRRVISDVGEALE